MGLYLVGNHVLAPLAMTDFRSQIPNLKFVICDPVGHVPMLFWKTALHCANLGVGFKPSPTIYSDRDLRARSSIGQSDRLRICRLEVQILSVAPNFI